MKLNKIPFLLVQVELLFNEAVLESRDLEFARFGIALPDAEVGNNEQGPIQRYKGRPPLGVDLGASVANAVEFGNREVALVLVDKEVSFGSISSPVVVAGDLVVVVEVGGLAEEVA